MNYNVITQNFAETQKLGFLIGKAIKAPCAILLDGELAAGKTTLTQGIARALGVTKTVNSPSFTIMKAYSSIKGDFFHLDLYRLSEVGADYDLTEYFEDSICVVEWPYQVKELLPHEYLLIKIKKLSDNIRKFDFIAYGKKYEEVIKHVSTTFR